MRRENWVLVEALFLLPFTAGLWRSSYGMKPSLIFKQKKIRLKKSKPELTKYRIDNLETLLLVCKTFSKNQIPPRDAAAGRRAFREAQSSVFRAQRPSKCIGTSCIALQRIGLGYC